MKKKILLNLLTILCILALTACGKENDSKTEDKNKDSKTAASTVNSSEEETPELPQNDSDKEATDDQAADEADNKTSDEKTTDGLLPEKETSDEATGNGTASSDRADDSVSTAAAPISYEDVKDTRIKKVCEAYGRYIDERINFFPEREYPPTFSTGFIDEDDIPELFYYDGPESGLLLCTYDEAADSVVEIEYFEYGPSGFFNYFFKDCLIANIYSDNQSSLQTIYSFDGDNIETVLNIELDILSDSVYINGEPATSEEANEQAAIYNDMSTGHRVDYVYGLIPDEKGRYSEQIYNITDWNGTYTDGTDYMNHLSAEAMKEYAGDWSLDGVSHYDPATSESTELNPFQCRAKFTVTKDGECNFSFSHEDVSISKEADGIEKIELHPYRFLNPDNLTDRYFLALAPDESYAVFIVQVDWDTIYVEYGISTDGQTTSVYDVQFTK